MNLNLDYWEILAIFAVSDRETPVLAKLIRDRNHVPQELHTLFWRNL
tara:strand:+ start:88 stop:228 length:141 start_codon:yes stop_codon:yes gene_type:complete